MMKKKADNLVTEFFEKISWKILEEYPQIINEMIKGKAGLYALYHGDKLYYVGLTMNLKGRLKTHLKDRHTGLWDRFSVYLVTEDHHIKPLESLVLRIVNPKGNHVKGHLPGASNLGRAISKHMSETDANNRAKLLGGSAVTRRIKAKATSKGTLGLKGVVEHRYILRATYKDKQYRATLRKDGLICFNTKQYESPTAAAKMIIKGRAVNGWVFWKYQNDAGEWVPLSRLRK
ncbi:GIY-YIG nuclease family protein [Sideroxydans lithotrophicus]|nr:GIY-YIG nuclease family protein [Sideroxydans lithotrophicus]